MSKFKSTFTLPVWNFSSTLNFKVNNMKNIYLSYSFSLASESETKERSSITVMAFCWPESKKTFVCTRPKREEDLCCLKNWSWNKNFPTNQGKSRRSTWRFSSMTISYKKSQFTVYIAVIWTFSRYFYVLTKIWYTHKDFFSLFLCTRREKKNRSRKTLYISLNLKLLRIASNFSCSAYNFMHRHFTFIYLTLRNAFWIIYNVY